jgi:hypothetical protein
LPQPLVIDVVGNWDDAVDAMNVDDEETGLIYSQEDPPNGKRSFEEADSYECNKSSGDDLRKLRKILLRRLKHSLRMSHSLWHIVLERLGTIYYK